MFNQSKFKELIFKGTRRDYKLLVPTMAASNMHVEASEISTARQKVKLEH